MRGKRVLAAMLCVVAAALVLLPAQRAAGEVTVYQTAVNEKMLELNTETMPALIDGSYYVPHTVFDRDVTGVNLGVSSGQWKSDTTHTLTIYSLSGMLIFDLNAGTCVDNAGISHNMRAVMRNGRVYVPLSGVCSYFGLRAAYTATPYGTLVRITNNQAVLSTEKFIDAASSLMKQRYTAYLRGLTPPPPPPVPGGKPPVPPIPPVVEPIPSDKPQRQEVRVCLAFRCGPEGDPDAIMDQLDRQGVLGLFFFRPEELAGRKDQLRRMAGSGHMVGLILPESTGDRSAAAYLEEGRRLLARIAHLSTHTLLVERGDPVMQTLEGQGWICWRGNVDGRSDGWSGAGLARSILSAVEGRRSSAMITMDDTATAAAALHRLLPELREERYNIRPPVETEL